MEEVGRKGDSRVCAAGFHCQAFTILQKKVVAGYYYFRLFFESTISKSEDTGRGSTPVKAIKKKKPYIT